MSNKLKRILLISSTFFMITGIGATSNNELAVNARHRIHTHRIYRHHIKRHARHYHKRYHFNNHKVSYTMPSSVIRNIRKARLNSKASYIKWYAKDISRASFAFYDHYSSKANSYNQGWSDSTNSNFVTNSHSFNTHEIISNPYYRLGIIDGIADTLSNSAESGAHDVNYRTMNRAINLILHGIRYAQRSHATDVGLNSSNTNWSWLD